MASAATASGRATFILYNPHYPSTPLHSGVARGARYVSLLCRVAARAKVTLRLRVSQDCKSLRLHGEYTLRASCSLSLRVYECPCETPHHVSPGAMSLSLRRLRREALRRRFRVFCNPNRHCTTEPWRRGRDVPRTWPPWRPWRLCRRGLAVWHCRKF